MKNSGWRALMAIPGYCFLLAPTLVVIPLSFAVNGSTDFLPQHFSLDLYRQFLESSEWVSALLRSVAVAAMATLAALAISFPAAYVLIRFRLPFQQAITILLMSPMFLPVVVVGLGMYLYFGKLGISDTLFGIAAGHTVIILPIVMLVLTGGLREIDQRLEVAVAISGGTRLDIWRRAVLPLCWPSVTSAGLFAFLLSFDDVIISWFVSDSATVTLPVKMYSAIQWEISPLFPVISTLFSMIALAFIVLRLALRGRED
jgi:putative spermidine/putrescine transport system permease protein